MVFWRGPTTNYWRTNYRVRQEPLDDRGEDNGFAAAGRKDDENTLEFLPSVEDGIHGICLIVAKFHDWDSFLGIGNYITLGFILRACAYARTRVRSGWQDEWDLWGAWDTRPNITRQPPTAERLFRVGAKFLRVALVLQFRLHARVPAGAAAATAALTADAPRRFKTQVADHVAERDQRRLRDLAIGKVLCGNLLLDVRLDSVADPDFVVAVDLAVADPADLV